MQLTKREDKLIIKLFKQKKNYETKRFISKYPTITTSDFSEAYVDRATNVSENVLLLEMRLLCNLVNVYTNVVNVR